MKTLVLAAVLGTTMLGGIAAAAQQPTPAPTSPPARADRWQGAAPDRDGVLSRADMLAAADARFARLDRNGDGVLASDEMMQRPRAARAEAEGAGPAPRAPRRFDTDGDGAISAEERAARRAARNGDGGGAMRGRGGMGGGGGMLARMDVDRNGSVSRDEFRADAAARFDRTDANRNGIIDAAERSARTAKMDRRMDRLRRASAAAAPAD